MERPYVLVNVKKLFNHADSAPITHPDDALASLICADSQMSQFEDTLPTLVEYAKNLGDKNLLNLENKFREEGYLVALVIPLS
jgi:hypothetical protein